MQFSVFNLGLVRKDLLNCCHACGVPCRSSYLLDQLEIGDTSPSLVSISRLMKLANKLEDEIGPEFYPNSEVGMQFIRSGEGEQKTLDLDQFRFPIFVILRLINFHSWKFIHLR